jgi:hypothetical protein
VTGDVTVGLSHYGSHMLWRLFRVLVQWESPGFALNFVPGGGGLSAYS